MLEGISCQNFREFIKNFLFVMESNQGRKGLSFDFDFNLLHLPENYACTHLQQDHIYSNTINAFLTL